MPRLKRLLTVGVLTILLLAATSQTHAELVRWELTGLVIDLLDPAGLFPETRRGDDLVGTLTYDTSIPAEIEDETEAFFPHAANFQGITLQIENNAGEVTASFLPSTAIEPEFSATMFQEQFEGEVVTSLFFSQVLTFHGDEEALAGVWFDSSTMIDFQLPASNHLDDWPIRSAFILFGDGDEFESFSYIEGHFFEATRVAAPIDLDGDGVLSVDDADLLCRAVPVGSKVSKLDVNEDGGVDFLDLSSLLEEANSLPGDANLDGSVDFGDFTVLSANFGSSLADWSDGDFNCDGRVSFPDFLVLSGSFGESFSAAHGIPVPEPASNLLLGVLLVSAVLGLRCGRKVAPSGRAL